MSILATAALALAISPAVVSGPAHSHASFTVSDHGSQAIVVNTAIVELGQVAGHPGAWVIASDADASHATVSADHFTLKPGESRKIIVRVSEDQARHDLGVMATATPLTPGHGSAKVSGSVVSRFVVNAQAAPAANQAPIHAEGAPASHGIPTATIPIVGGFLVLLAGAGLWLRRRFSHKEG